MVNREKMRKWEPYSPSWERAANRLARSFSPGIHPCKKCGYPVIHGYCCTGCGDTNPSSREEEE